MASANSKTVVVAVFSLLLLVSMSEASGLFGLGFGKVSQSAPTCDTVIGRGPEDTCFAIAKQFKLTTEFFNAINPNINCDVLFVGQWICVAGTA
ncbi:hypothetical protein GIB67_025189 [Kingdonia uniflora]|uniref:LysM domain-containing protein n=1 Tax=Kingdonia uniflora TaxID=39325 RepID=A0A7J7N852_9MAGN|nr:hypothetical protein GIB67_025189 [Kingdonia uniflora]